MHSAFQVIQKLMSKSSMDLPQVETFLENPELQENSVNILGNPTTKPVRKLDDAKRLFDILDYHRKIRLLYGHMKAQTETFEEEDSVDLDEMMNDMETVLLGMRTEVEEERMYHCGKGGADDDGLVEGVFSDEMPRLVPSTFDNFDSITQGFGATDLVILASHMKGGKCVDGSTLIETEKGLIPIKSLFDGTEKDDEFTPLGIEVVDRYGVATATQKFTKVHDSAVSLTSSYGYSLKGSPVHPILVLDCEDYTLKYKKMSDIVTGDCIVLNKKNHLFPRVSPSISWKYSGIEPQRMSCTMCSYEGTGLPTHLYRAHPEINRESYKETNHPELVSWPQVHDSTDTSYTLPNEMSEDLAYILGYLVAEGQMLPSVVSFSQSDPKVMQDFCDRFEKVFPDFPLAIEEQKNSPKNKRAYIRSKYISEFLSHIGLNSGHSSTRVIPHIVLKSQKSHVQAFLQSYFEGDGGGEKGRIFTCTSASSSLIDQLQQMLLRFGVVSKKKDKRSRATNGSNTYKDYYTLVISRKYVNTFLEEVGFVTQRKIDSVSHIERRSDPVPFIEEATSRVRKKHMVTSNGFYELPCGTRKRLSLHSQPNVELSQDALKKRPEILEGLNHFYPGLVEAVKESVSSGFFFDEVIEVVEIPGEIKLYDLSVPGSHSYVANGMVVHNSVMALNMGIEQYLQHGLDVIYIPLEMSKDETAERMLSKISTVEHTKIRTKTWNDMEKKHVMKSYKEFKKVGLENDARFTVWPIASLTIPQLRMRLKPMKYQVIIIDYLNLIIDPTNNPQDWLKLGNFAKDLKILTKELDCLIVAPTQMNMDGEIRYSKAIKEHANTVWTWVYGEEEQGTHVITVKQPAVRGWAPFPFQLREDFSRMEIRDHLGSDLLNDDDFKPKPKNERMKGV